MTTPHDPSPLHALVRAEIEEGLRMAEDPANANLPDLTLRVTTIDSPWFSRTCRVCKDRFREGDQVRLCPRCQDASHDDRQFGLACWHRRFAAGKACKPAGPGTPPDASCPYVWGGQLPDDHANRAAARATPPTSLITPFMAGLRGVWRPFGERATRKVEPGSPLARRVCPWCRFRVRVGDWVIGCPCGCGTFFHEDVFRHLTCWNEWNGVGGNQFCPNTGRPYPEVSDAPA